MDIDDFLLAMLIAVLGTFIIGFAVGGKASKNSTQREAISVGVGRYNSTNANFEWIQCK